MSTPTLPAIHSYLFFSGRCEEALAFYTSAIGAKVNMMMRFSECPDPIPEGQLAPGYENKIMHADFTIGSSMVMASDGCGTETPGFHGFGLSITLKDEDEVDRVFNALSPGGNVIMPLGKTFWSPRFGMLNDKFGICWMVGVHVEQQA